MDGQACPNVAVQPGSECVRRCGCSAEYCRRLMGGGGHIVSAPTKQEGASRASVHMQGLCDLARCTWCRLGGGVMTCASRSRSGMWRNPTGDDWVSSAHKHGSRGKVASSMTVLAHRFPPPSLIVS